MYSPTSVVPAAMVTAIFLIALFFPLLAHFSSNDHEFNHWYNRNGVPLLLVLIVYVMATCCWHFTDHFQAFDRPSNVNMGTSFVTSVPIGIQLQNLCGSGVVLLATENYSLRTAIVTKLTLIGLTFPALVSVWRDFRFARTRT